MNRQLHLPVYGNILLLMLLMQVKVISSMQLEYSARLGGTLQQDSVGKLSKLQHIF